MAGKLKLRCGSQFTSKMEGMMNDLAIGGDHEAAFERYLKDGQDGGSVDVDKIDFNVQARVLSVASAPSQPSVPRPPRPPFFLILEVRRLLLEQYRRIDYYNLQSRQFRLILRDCCLLSFVCAYPPPLPPLTTTWRSPSWFFRDASSMVM